MKNPAVAWDLIRRGVTDCVSAVQLRTDSEMGLYCACKMIEDRGILCIGLNSRFKVVTCGYISDCYLDELCNFCYYLEEAIGGENVKYAVVSLSKRQIKNFKYPFLIALAQNTYEELHKFGIELLKVYAVSDYDYENLL